MDRDEFKKFYLRPIKYRHTINDEFKALKQFKNIHKGKRIFIIATGPSLREEDLVKLKDEITIGVNGVVALSSKIDWRPTYYCISDSTVMSAYREEILKENYEHIFTQYRTYAETNKEDFPHKPYCYYLYSSLGDSLRGMADRPSRMHFSSDPSRKGIYRGGLSITTTAMQLAAYMGASEIILYGVDCNYNTDKQYFDDRRPKWEMHRLDFFTSQMMIFCEYCNTYGKRHGIKFLNATRGGMLEAFERVDLDELLGIKNE